jgi:hypothetical protein
MRRLLVTLSALPILSLPPIYTILITTPTAASPAISLYPPWSPSSHSHSLSRRAASVRSFPPSFLNLGCTGFTPSAHTRQPDRLAHHPTSHFIPYTPSRHPAFGTAVLRALTPFRTRSYRIHQHFVPRKRLFRLTPAVLSSVAPQSSAQPTSSL